MTMEVAISIYIVTKIINSSMTKILLNTEFLKIRKETEINKQPMNRRLLNIISTIFLTRIMYANKRDSEAIFKTYKAPIEPKRLIEKYIDTDDNIPIQIDVLVINIVCLSAIKIIP